MANKSVETKRKIISHIRNRDSKEALKLFFKSFSQEKPPELEFLKNVYVELNRLNLHKENFDLLAQVGIWYPDNVEFQDIFENASKIYVDSLILQANNITFQRIEKEKSLEESLKRADSLTREKMQVENSKQLSALTEKAKELYKLAVQYSPKNLIAHKGWLECCLKSGEEEEAAEVKKKIAALSPSIREKAVILKESIINQQDSEIDYSKVSEDKDTYTELLELLNNKQYQELINKVNQLNTELSITAKILILKTKALLELRRFNEADKAIFEAESLNTDFLEVKATKEEIATLKHKLYSKAGSAYLEKGIKLGVALGFENLKKSKYCLLKALELNPDNLDLLDQAYTVLKYLNENDEALRIKGAIYSLDPVYKTSYDLRYSKTLCFIATYAYNDRPDIVNDFRWFRREFLLNNKIGIRINSLYVNLSSRITKAILYNKNLRYFCRLILLFPLFFVKLIKYTRENFRK